MLVLLVCQLPSDYVRNWTSVKYDMDVGVGVFFNLLLLFFLFRAQCDGNIHSLINAFSRRFYPKRLTVHSGYTFVLSACLQHVSNM